MASTDGKTISGFITKHLSSSPPTFDIHTTNTALDDIYNIRFTSKLTGSVITESYDFKITLIDCSLSIITPDPPSISLYTYDMRSGVTSTIENLSWN